MSSEENGLSVVIESSTRLREYGWTEQKVRVLPISAVRIADLGRGIATAKAEW